MHRALILLFLLSGPAAALEPPKLNFGGQIRARAETTSLQGYSSPGVQRGRDMLLLRSRLNLGVDAAPQRLKAFLQLQDSRTAGSEASVSSNEKNLDLHQGYLDVLDFFGRPLDLRAGRFEMSYGDQRLVSPLDWSNVGNAWDGIRLKWRGAGWWSDLFATNVKEVSHSRADSHFWGAYGQLASVPGHEFDAYLFGRDNADGSYTNEHGTRGNLSDRTLGARMKGKRGGSDYTAEAAWQFGRKARQRVRAWATAETAGHTFDIPWKPRIGLEHTFASGDSDPSDNQTQTFDPLFPFLHFYQGYQDVFAWKNGHDLALRLHLDPVPGWRLQTDFHHFLLQHSFDSWYEAAGTAVARDTTGAAGRDIGNELDVHLKGMFREMISLWLGYSHFFAGSFVRSTTGRGDRDWAFFQATFNF